MDHATGLGHRRSAASLALSARRPATVYLKITIIETPPVLQAKASFGVGDEPGARPREHGVEVSRYAQARM